MKKFDTIAALKKAVDDGELDEAKLTVVMDNDCSSIYYAPAEEGPEEDDRIFAGKGHYDTEDLWPLVLPKATVEWC